MVVAIKQEGGKWVVYDGIVRFSRHNTVDEAKKNAGLLRTAISVTEEIEEFAEAKLAGLTEEERKFLIDYAGENICVEI